MVQHKSFFFFSTQDIIKYFYASMLYTLSIIYNLLFIFIENKNEAMTRKGSYFKVIT
jgi:hypothetical protein